MKSINVKGLAGEFQILFPDAMAARGFENEMLDGHGAINAREVASLAKKHGAVEARTVESELDKLAADLAALTPALPKIPDAPDTLRSVYSPRDQVVIAAPDTLREMIATLAR